MKKRGPKRITVNRNTVEKAGATFEEKVQKGEIIMLTKWRTKPFKFRQAAK